MKVGKIHGISYMNKRTTKKPIKPKYLTKLLWSSGIGTPAGVPAPGFEPWPLRNLTYGLQHPRPKTVTR